MQTAQLQQRQRPQTVRSANRRPRHCSSVLVRASAGQHQSPALREERVAQPSRRDALLSALSVPLIASLGSAGPASASAPASASFPTPPSGFRLIVDKLDGYSFFVPENWLTVTSSGNDIFLRNPRSVEENLFVDFTSPSSSRYNSVEDLGTPKDAANRLLDQFLTKEFMSTRLGIARYGEVVKAERREADDGQLYYDIAIRMTSYGSTNAYAATRQEVLKNYSLEWDRTLTTVLGVSNQRLYTLRLQSPTPTYEKSLPTLRTIMDSFRVRTVDV